MLDLHTHLLPGVDDGAPRIEETRTGLAALSAQGVSAVMLTPHFQASLTEATGQMLARLAELDTAWASLEALMRSEFAGLRIFRGAELMLDTPIPEFEDPRLRLAGGEFLLVEFPGLSIPPRSVEALQALRAKGFRPVIAHPERYPGIAGKLEIAADWRRNGAFLQVNHGSLLGDYGPMPRQAAFLLLQRGWADYLSSDFHSRGKPRIAAGLDALRRAGGAEQAELLAVTNPERLVQGQAPLPVPPLPVQRGIFARLLAALR